MAKKPASKPKEIPAAGKPSALVDTRVIYCGDNLDQLHKLPDECVDLIYIDPPFNSNRNYEVFWGETKEKRAFEDRHPGLERNAMLSTPRHDYLPSEATIPQTHYLIQWSQEGGSIIIPRTPYSPFQ